MDRPLLFSPEATVGHPLAAAIGASRHSIALGIILAAHLGMVALVAGGWGAFSGPLILLALYLVGFLLLCERSRFTLWVLGVGGIALGASAVSLADRGTLLTAMALGWHALFEGLLIIFLLGRLFRQRKMPVDAVMAGIIAFLFMAGLWVQFYGLLVLFDPGSVRGPDGGLGPHPYITLYYFSIITLTTVGFGDVQPVSDMARMLAAYEALIGQVYLAVFIALLMGRHFAFHGPSTSPPPKS